uniref:Uncharacterized protein n=1 Tax=Chaetoceros debilis TaxID=122233 RepID=A0A7S3V6W8_9STRA
MNLTRRLLKMSRYGAATISTAIKSGDLQIAPTKNNKASEYKTTNDFFDRMSKSETYASADAKGKIERNQKNPEGKKNQWTRKERDPGQKTTSDFFDRLSKKETFSTADLKGKPQPSLKKNTNTNSVRSSKVKKTTSVSYFNY